MSSPVLKEITIVNRLFPETERLIHQVVSTIDLFIAFADSTAGTIRSNWPLIVQRLSSVRSSYQLTRDFMTNEMEYPPMKPYRKPLTYLNTELTRYQNRLPTVEQAQKGKPDDYPEWIELVNFPDTRRQSKPASTCLSETLQNYRWRLIDITNEES